ncbi:E3 ubiquitin-protein ligase TRIM39-like isoform X2 [Colossoma macropomum]|uniref:E3 ubiquitin-protein ligase TRIM39-like isoform X2 n=1 Tax=Colossoma macropomum TaxID=42526 RepID=UPI001864DC60|nr:E3 ubiquitin-protein ligase TRIM39-like isoform X2 [Colossoma macropomum]
MASSLSPLEQDLLCPVCFFIFTDPVFLSCGHSFCRTCLQQNWTKSSGRECPVCRRWSSKTHPPPDLALRKACESYKQQKRSSDSGSQGLLCSLHSEKLSLFCVDDQKLVCGQCVSQDHQSHSFCSISKAAGLHKIQTCLTELKKKLQIFHRVKIISDQVAAHIVSQAQNTERQIKEEFGKLHQFLREEEEARITALRNEEMEKSHRMKKKIEDLDSQIKDISARIVESNERLKDDEVVLQGIQTMYERAQYTRLDPELDSGALIDVAKHLGNLRFQVLRRLKDLCPYFPVILDPNTANSSLSISADLSSVSPSPLTQLPDNPERMSMYSGVLGSEGFSSGTHSWEVEVGYGEDWVIGVAEESVSRKEICVAAPENGFCCIWRVENTIYAGTGINSNVKVAKEETIKTIRVTLNWEKGQVIFFSKDKNKVLYTFKHRFTKKMYPCFYNNSTNSVNSMKILSFPSHFTIKQ